MSVSHYGYTPQELNNVYTTLEKTLFDVRRDIGAEGQPAPKILVVAGVQGSGKTYMLNNTLLKDPRYGNYVRLYSEELRELHPRYTEFADQDVTSRYKHTEAFIWELCSLIFAHAYKNKFNIIMETALDTKAFATVITGAELADYQFDVHLIGCKKDFVHLSTIKRALNALENGSLERFVDIATIETSIDNAEVILNAFETACMRVSGSTISMYERGFGALVDRKKLCSSRCDRINTLTPLVFTDENGATITLQEQTHRIERSEQLSVPCSYGSFIALVEAPVSGVEDRREAWQEAYAALARMRRFWKQIPPRLPETLWGYIKKYVE
ncbi:MAG: zeta toxin family protein [Pseudomonas sp.]|uniref:zeta toxin family protein n=1 Tax=Pseudomonas sp. TaxID=306 RepID=UPI003D6E591B